MIHVDVLAALKAFTEIGNFGVGRDLSRLHW
jgi:hypothetical protein